MSENNSHFLDASDLPWMCAETRGVSFKSLRFDHETRAGAVLVHMCPGTTYPRHHVHAGEDVYVVDGELILDERALGRGAYVWVAPGTVQAPRTDRGCVLFVTYPGPVEHLHDGA